MFPDERRRLMSETAEELAHSLRALAAGPRNHTMGASMLDEATLVFGWTYEQVGPAQRAFSTARHTHMRFYNHGDPRHEDLWDQVLTAAGTLAAALEPLGSARVRHST